MPVTHEPWLVALSLVMAFQGSFVGLNLAVQVGRADAARRRLLLAGAALTLALAIWSMHFVGMLAARLPVAANFLVLPTLLSFLVCVLVVGLAVFAASNGRLTPVRLGLAAFVMGSGICTMHYLGMYALHDSLAMQHEPAYVFGSFLIAFNAAGLAIWLLFGLGRRPHIVVSAAVLALAISAMHYTAMTGMTFGLIQPDAAIRAPMLSPGVLAIVVSCVAFLVSGLFLLALVPAQEDTSAVDTEAAPARKPASGLQAAANPGRNASGTSRRSLPIERDGQKCQIGVQDIVAIHADAHYTRIHDGARDCFCPLSISEAEQQLDPKIFNRVHRSHIVNLNRVASFKRSGDGGVLVLAGSEGQIVPVSRSRWGRVKKRLSAIEDAPLSGEQPIPAE
ncbi:MHYT domain-containing protein [Roseibium sediminicola]|uniref:LytTR family transcriptional regulator DNA-binding domain-containing protein n=1 Tax=Roseibium sediminicola TaxID=2933272 RepID=A0ABT0GPS9_9HYPH|nr:MHYT domain-containing protein [Roseibium sp. CAU 1639]MCK7611438.1 LytTR family transcriptional regulator DNA-binding domain-containing protein [Roseibium sp. CAU 1639]